MFGYETSIDEINGWDSTLSNNGVDLFDLDEIEKLLMSDEADVSTLDEFPDEINGWDLLLDSPVRSGDEAKNFSGSNTESNSSEEEEKLDDVADTIDKKQMRQLRNRDAAVRSRERKKMYVKDLEMKSRYLEGECRRLGILLQCCSAENQALRLSLQNAKAYDASMTKQESAVLVLESLLLGSLLWFLGIMCLFNLPRPLSPPENVGEKVQGSLVLLKKPLNHDRLLSFRLSQLFLMSRRCKGSRSRIKPSFLNLVVCRLIERFLLYGFHVRALMLGLLFS